ncbi:MAG: MarR family transcriptional regulator [Succiniclasticum sp.]|jgi:DNA-binding MarR family transcriptional regulator|nr:MarR family transcriptional regulator [Succiniclasticum sp.]
MNKNNACNPLLLKNQLCFPLYASARKIVAAYAPFLKKIGLTYAQYVTMMVLWEETVITMRDLGERLYLDSGTLTPVLKRLEALGYVKRYRKPEDERVVVVEITPQGTALRKTAEQVPYAMGCLLNQKGALLTPEEVEDLRKKLYRILHALEG